MIALLTLAASLTALAMTALVLCERDRDDDEHDREVTP